MTFERRNWEKETRKELKTPLTAYFRLPNCRSTWTPTLYSNSSATNKSLEFKKARWWVNRRQYYKQKTMFQQRIGLSEVEQFNDSTWWYRDIWGTNWKPEREESTGFQSGEKTLTVLVNENSAWYQKFQQISRSEHKPRLALNYVSSLALMETERPTRTLGKWSIFEGHGERTWALSHASHVQAKDITSSPTQTCRLGAGLSSDLVFPADECFRMNDYFSFHLARGWGEVILLSNTPKLGPAEVTCFPRNNW